MYSNIVVAGTFDSLHRGHRLLLGKALSKGKHVHMGLTTDSFVLEKKVKVRRFGERKESLLKFLGKKAGKTTIFALNDAFGPAISEKRFDAIVVSEETRERAIEINDIRTRNGLRPLHIIKIPLAFASDYKKISDERIRKKEIDTEGRRLKPITLALGTTNKAKLEGTERIAKRVFKCKVKVIGIEVRVERQPFGERTLEGAIFRAMEAKNKVEADYYVGLESGLFEFKQKYFDILWCTILDESDLTLGNSMGFEIDKEIVDEILKNNSDMSEVFSKMSGISEIGKKNGAIGFLSKGLTKRSDMIEQAFLCAMIPRIAKTIHFSGLP